MVNEEVSEFPGTHGRVVAAILAVLVLMLTATVGAGWVTKKVVENRVKNFFQRQADQIANTYYQDMATSVVMLEGVRSLWNSLGVMDHQRFTLFVDTYMKHNERPTGASSFFYIPEIDQDGKAMFVNKLQKEPAIPAAYERYALHPESNKEELYPVAYVAPLEGRERSLGLNFGTDETRLAAILYAKDNDELATTNATILQTTGNPGFFFLLPLYESDKPIERVAERRIAFVGVVGVAFRSKDAFKQIFGQEDPYPYLDFQVYQGEEVSPERLLHDHDPSFVASDPMFETTRIVRLRGQTWTIVVSSKPGAVLGSSEENLPVWVFGVGIVSTTAAITYFVSRYLKHLQEHSLVR